MDEEVNEEGISNLKEDEREEIEQTRGEPDIPSERNESYENKAELPKQTREEKKNEEASGEDESELEMTANSGKVKVKRQRRKRKKKIEIIDRNFIRKLFKKRRTTKIQNSTDKKTKGNRKSTNR